MEKESTFISFMMRRLLERKCDEWIQRNGALPCTFTVITYLAAQNMLRLDDVKRVISEEVITDDKE